MYSQKYEITHIKIVLTKVMSEIDPHKKSKLI